MRKIGSSGVVPALIKALRDPFDTRPPVGVEAAAIALGTVGPGAKEVVVLSKSSNVINLRVYNKLPQSLWRR